MAAAKIKALFLVALAVTATVAPLSFVAYKATRPPPVSPPVASVAPAPPPAAPSFSRYAKWKNGPSTDPSFFPIGVWAQDVKDAADYKKAGINVYVHLWDGPSEDQLADIKAAGMRVICRQNAVGLAHKDDPTIVAWFGAHQPDQNDGPPMSPAALKLQYDKMTKADPTRPSLIILSQGVAWDGFPARDTRSGAAERYADYLKACDIASFNIYPVTHPDPGVAGKLWYVPLGVDRLRQWSNDKAIVWNFIETTQIESQSKPTPAQVKSEVWMSLIHGSTGIIYFAHQFKPVQDDHALLDDETMLNAVRAINGRVASLAPALNSATVVNGASAASSNPQTSVDCMLKRIGGETYLFAVNMKDEATTATFDIRESTPNATAAVLDENRSIAVVAGHFSDSFTPYAVHLYRIK